MTNGRASETRRHFILTWLPWILGLAAFGLYFATLNRSLSFLPDWMAFFGVAPSAARLAGWSWQPETFTPAYYLVTFPLRWLPAAAIPLATNLFSAVCAALALVQLARAVALLPYDRTRDQRERETGDHALLTIPLAWLPPVFAVLLCALGLGFWEQGTNGTVEMFDLLLFSYIVRSLLEYRLDEQETRLYRAAFVLGVGMSGNVAMVGFLPLFIVSLVWSRQLGFFNLRFLGRLTACGLAGLLFYLLLPTISSLAHDSTLNFWDALKLNLTAQRYVLGAFPKKTLLLLSLTSVLPVFLLSIRWASQFGDPSRIGAICTTAIFHVCHVVILLACVWVAFDPAFSPRQAGLGFTFLPLYYLGALSVGYYSGYLLLVSRAVATRLRPADALARTIQHATAAFVLALLVLAPVGLLYRNLPQIRLTNGAWQQQLTADLAAGLPRSGVILSDDARRLMLVQDWLARHGRANDYVALNTQWLKQPEYHRYLQRRYRGWPSPVKDPKAKTVSDTELIQLLQQLSKEKPICYLHPSFGYYFEFFLAEPNGLTFNLTPYPSAHLLPPPVSAETIARNEKFWNAAQEGILKTLLPLTRPPETHRPSGLDRFFSAISVKPEPNRVALGMGALYSRNLVVWGVKLQEAGQYEKAAHWFQLAHDLNPDNVVAEVNLEANQKFRAGEDLEVTMTKSIDEWFGKSRTWEEVLAQNGPFDEPSRSYAQGFVFARGNLFRQAAQEFERVRTLATNDLASRLWLAQLNLSLNFPDQALAMAEDARNCAKRVPGASTNLTDLFTLEASAYFAKKEPETATKILEDNLKANPGNFALLGAVCRTYADQRRFTNALDITARMIALQPDNPASWLNRGCFLVELNDYEQAISSFDRVLNLETNNAIATLYRAIANLRSGKLDAALRDYEVARQQYPKAYQIYYGLGEIAYRRKDTNTALRHYESYLSNAPPDFAEAKIIADRIRELRGQPPETKK